METRANYIATGAFTLAVILGVFGFVYWVQTLGSGSGNQITYRIIFSGSVSGLRPGAAVTFDGIRVGEVNSLRLDPHNPGKVEAMVGIERGIPLRADTKVLLSSQGLTGVTQVSLTGGAADAPEIVAEPGQPPTIVVNSSATADLTQAAREVLARIDGMVADNESVLRASLKNIESVTGALARNSDRLDQVMAGIEHLTGSGDNPGELGATAASIRRLADDLDKRTNEISVGLTTFTNSGLKEFQAFAVDGRRTLAELNKAIKNFDEHPSRIIFGR
jgi:phospholipid/cholesterol/gamma-HCH transport system substrate-binding protein